MQCVRRYCTCLRSSERTPIQLYGQSSTGISLNSTNHADTLASDDYASPSSHASHAGSPLASLTALWRRPSSSSARAPSTDPPPEGSPPLKREHTVFDLQNVRIEQEYWPGAPYVSAAAAPLVSPDTQVNWMPNHEASDLDRSAASSKDVKDGKDAAQ